jgi:phosphate starvation-inducible protein PhoH and related proteins
VILSIPEGNNMTQTRHANRKGKRNKAKVVDDRWEKKKEVGRVVKDEDRSYVKPPVTAKNTKQAEFLSALKTHQVIVFTAPAGVGKSFLTMCEVTDWLKKGLYDKIILSRPSVGMGNTIGLLKGGLVEKYTPFLLPMIDVIKERYGTGFYEIV